MAAGESRRMGGVNKLFVTLRERPLLTYALEPFVTSPLIDEIVLVLAQGQVGQGQHLIESLGYAKAVQICPGGARRQDSVRCGLELLSNCAWVVIHDGARPCTGPELITSGLEVAQETGAAIAAIPVTDTVKAVDSAGKVVETLDRERLWTVQTPQVFRRDLLEEAHRQVTETVTDDAAMVERLGCSVRVFPGSHTNLKVTTPSDLVLAEAILQARCASGD